MVGVEEVKHIMKEKDLGAEALFRYGIIAPLITGTLDESKPKKEFFQNASAKYYEDENGKTVKVSSYTIARWYRTYKKNGFDGLKPKRRSDHSLYRKLDDDMKAQIKYLKQEYPRLPATLIHQKLIDNGTIRKDDISLSTINRYVNTLKKENGETNHKDMRRYERKHINEVWCGDSSVGPYIKVDGKKVRTYVIALIDDASRFIVGIDIFFNDNTINLMSVIRSAVIKYGKPKIFNFDNGSNYRSKQMSMMAARMGSVINYCAPYTPTSKAKIERWFRTMKDRWMSSLNMQDYKNIDELRISLMKFIQTYNQSSHSSLEGHSPQERFFEESSLINRIAEQSIDHVFLFEIERKVSNDNVIVIDSVEYEVNYHYAGQKVMIRYAPDLSRVYIVDHETEELKEIKLLNKHENSHIKREKVMMTGGDT